MTKADVINHGGAGLLACYDGSLRRALETNYSGTDSEIFYLHQRQIGEQSGFEFLNTAIRFGNQILIEDLSSFRLPINME